MTNSKYRIRGGRLTTAVTAGLLLLSLSVRSAPVSELEAVGLADNWYTAEVEAHHTKLSQPEREERLATIGGHKIAFLMSEDSLADFAATDDAPLAYIVSYKPSGYVIVSGDDRIQPVIAFSVNSEFSFEDHPDNFMRYFMAKDVANRWRNLGQKTHEDWSRFLSMTKDGFKALASTEAGSRDVTYVMWETAEWSQGGYYNDVCEGHNGGYNVPTGCTATAMAIKMRYHCWPHQPEGSHAYGDTWGSIQYEHAVNYDAAYYDFGAMPTTDLTGYNFDVAQLMYQCGVATDMDYEEGGSGAWLDVGNFNSIFRYRGTHTHESDHEDGIIVSVIGQQPTIVSTPSHSMVICGYRTEPEPYFYVNDGHAGSGDGWYGLGDLPANNPMIARSYPYCGPETWVYVDQSVPAGSYQDGALDSPYNDLDMGMAQMDDFDHPGDGHLFLKGDIYEVAGATVFDYPMTWHAYNGPATIQ